MKARPTLYCICLCKFSVFNPKITFYRTSWQPHGLSHIHAICVNLPDFHGPNLVIFSKWKIENWWIWKIKFFESPIFNSKIFFFVSSPLKSVTNYRLAWMGLNFYDYHGFQPKITPAYLNICKTVYFDAIPQDFV